MLATDSRTVAIFNKVNIPFLFSILDGCAIYLIIINYYFGIDLLFLINVNLALHALYLLTNFRGLGGPAFLQFVLLVTLCVSLIKTAVQPIFINDINYRFTATSLYSLIMPIVALSFSKHLSSNGLVELSHSFKRLANIYFIAIGPGIVLYYYLYYKGLISYFGLGFSLQYFLPFVISKINIQYIVLFVLVILSGKRAVMLVFIMQSILIHLNAIKRNALVGLLGLIAVGGGLWYTYNQTDLLHRFNWVFDGSFDINDKQSSMAAAGGRIEEIDEIIKYLDGNLIKYIFGTFPSESYTEEQYTDREIEKNYAHISFFGYMFRYGIFTAVLIFAFFIYLIRSAVENITEISIGVVGIMLVTFTGANTMTDPAPWVMIGYYYKTKKS